MSSRIFIFLLSVSMFAAAQNSALKLALPDNDFIHQQFGDSCNLVSAWPPMIADLNGDGIDDVVIVARCKNPLIDQDEKNYKVVDPMDSFFGYGNPKITSAFAPDDPKLRGIDLLVIHGSGADAWKSAIPQAKFAIINLPIKTLSLKRMKVKKKRVVNAMYVEEASADEMTSVIFWDGKKYRYQPLGSATE